MDKAAEETVDSKTDAAVKGEAAIKQRWVTTPQTNKRIILCEIHMW